MAGHTFIPPLNAAFLREQMLQLGGSTFPSDKPQKGGKEKEGRRQKVDKDAARARGENRRGAEEKFFSPLSLIVSKWGGGRRRRQMACSNKSP